MLKGKDKVTGNIDFIFATIIVLHTYTCINRYFFVHT